MVEQVLIPNPLQPIVIKGIRILPFDDLSCGVPPPAGGTPQGVPATASLVEFNGKRWLFPGDTRNYHTGSLPSFGPVDGLVAHMWLGHGCALTMNRTY